MLKPGFEHKTTAWFGDVLPFAMPVDFYLFSYPKKLFTKLHWKIGSYSMTCKVTWIVSMGLFVVYDVISRLKQDSPSSIKWWLNYILCNPMKKWQINIYCIFKSSRITVHSNLTWDNPLIELQLADVILLEWKPMLERNLFMFTAS